MSRDAASKIASKTAREIANKTVSNAAKISVLFILPDLSGGGAERTIINILQHIDRDRFLPYLGLLSATGEYLKLIPPNDITIIELPKWLSHSANMPSNSVHTLQLQSLLPRLLRVPASIYQIRALVTQLDPDIVLSSMTGLNVLTAIALKLQTKRSIRWIAREGNNFRVNLERLVKHSGLRTLVLKMIQISYRQTDRILTISQGSRTEVIQLFKLPPHQVAHIYNPVNLSQIQRSHQTKSKNHTQPLLLSNDGKYIVAVGRLQPQKGFKYLLKALHICHHQHGLDDLNLIILGEGNLRPQLEQQIQTLQLHEHVTLAGFVENPWRYIQAAEAFVLSSLWECFAHVVVEAMACNVPVVATACDYGPQEIIDNKATGILVQPQDAEALAQAIAHIITNPIQAANLVKNAAKRAQDFDAAKITHEYESLFQDVIAHNRKKT